MVIRRDVGLALFHSLTTIFKGKFNQLVIRPWQKTTPIEFNGNYNRNNITTQRFTGALDIASGIATYVGHSFTFCRTSAAHV